jgi:hypothetical protein
MARGVLAVLVVLGVLAAAAQGARPRPALRLLAKSPVTLRGTSFHARERVRVTAIAEGAKRVVSTRATKGGSFTAQLPAAMPYDPCLGALTVTAVGRSGDSATLKLPQRACPPQP